MVYDLITKYTSPNSSPRSYYGHSGGPTGITIHHWGSRGQRFENVVSWLCNPAAGTSAHYIVEDGRVACIISPDRAGWHSGNTVGNGSTIGIECRPEATDGDYETVAALVADLREAYGNLPLYPHRHWAATACPGVWDLDRIDRLANNTHGIPAAGPVTPIKEKDWFDMADKKDLRDIISGYVGDVVEVPGNVLGKNAKNKAWMVKNALTSIWRYSRDARDDSRKALAIVEALAENPQGLSKGDIDKIKGAVEETLKDATVDVDVNVRGQQ